MHTFIYLFTVSPLHTEVPWSRIESESQLPDFLCTWLKIKSTPLQQPELLQLDFFFSFLGPHPRHMEVSRPGVESELQLTAYTTTIATWDLSHICDLCHSCGNTGSLTHWARPGIKPTSSWILAGFVTCWTTTGTPAVGFLTHYTTVGTPKIHKS